MEVEDKLTKQEIAYDNRTDYDEDEDEDDGFEGDTE